MYRWLGIVASLTVWSAVAQDYPPTKPFLRIETGMHTAEIKGMDTDASGRFLVTASYDKTARIWDAKDGRLLGILRPTQGDGDEGKLCAVAMIPDGSAIAVGGYTGPSDGTKSIYLFDRGSAKLSKRIGGLPDTILHLAYSHDGAYLAVALAGRNGLRVYRTSDLHEIASDPKYGDRSFWAEFDPAGRLVTTSDDGYVRLYDSRFRLVKRAKPPSGRIPRPARFSPDGSKIAVGFVDITVVDVLSGRNLSLLYSAKHREPTDSDWATVSWSPDGASLYATGTDDSGSLWFWKERGEAHPTFPLARGRIEGLRAISPGTLAFASDDPKVGVVDLRGKPVWSHDPANLDLIRTFSPLRVSNDGALIAFSFNSFDIQFDYPDQPALFSVSECQLKFEGASEVEAVRPRSKWFGFH